MIISSTPTPYGVFAQSASIITGIHGDFTSVTFTVNTYANAQALASGAQPVATVTYQASYADSGLEASLYAFLLSQPEFAGGNLI